MNELASYLPLTLLGAILGLDVVSFPQAMISRPLVAATLAGALVGAPARGLLAGVVLELFALETLPFGASRYPEWGSAAVVGGALFAVQRDGVIGALTFAAFAALVTASVGGWSMIQHRRLIARWAGGMREPLAAGDADAVIGLQLRGLTADLVRGGLMTFIGLVIFTPLSRAVMAAWTMSAAPSRGVLVGCAGAVALGAVWKVVHTTTGARWYLLAGLVGGAAIVTVLA